MLLVLKSRQNIENLISKTLVDSYKIKVPKPKPSQTSTWELKLYCEKTKLDYQLDLVTPGIFPARAISRKRTRLMPNLRM